MTVENRNRDSYQRTRDQHESKKMGMTRLTTDTKPKSLQGKSTEEGSFFQHVQLSGIFGGFLSHRGTPSHHPFIFMGFSRSQKPSSVLGVPPFSELETPMTIPGEDPPMVSPSIPMIFINSSEVDLVGGF